MSAAKRSRIESQWEAAGGYFYILNQPSCWTFPNCNKTDCLPAQPLNLPHGKCRPWSFSVHFGSSAFVNGISQPSIQPRTHRDLARYRTSTQGRLPLDQIFQESLDHIFFFHFHTEKKIVCLVLCYSPSISQVPSQQLDCGLCGKKKEWKNIPRISWTPRRGLLQARPSWHSWMSSSTHPRWQGPTLSQLVSLPWTHLIVTGNMQTAKPGTDPGTPN